MEVRCITRWLAGAALTLMALAAVAQADEGEATRGEGLLAARCAGCHNLTGPAPDTLKALWARKGPDLFYAGNKFQEEWLEEWLANPQPIRPAGKFYAEHLKAGEKRDEVDPATLAPHPRLAPDEVKAVAEALMTRTANARLVEGVKIEDVSLSLMMGDMLFDKFRGCIACHRSAPDYGGLSGPELYTAARRLQPAFIYSYMKNPQAWDPRIWMPNVHLQEADLQKLVRYMALIAEEAK